ncbi:DUF4747 family protein [Mesorhizobium jarvisii]|uniref:DUF4747 family protein n=1 Tax=Mesorhizobium jarvisii TaxID=1777867 RepID=UPI001F0AC546|nr:DUF4747 family protein [Mesorhizobium jarvisii]MCH4560879.1 DUF4747 family protein [Mesorhizobium jarvisii]
MARKLKVSAGILNIRLHPHSPEIYAAFLYDIFRAKAMANVHGDRFGMISQIDRSEVESGRLTGVITTFLRIETDGQWFNSESLTEATEDQVSSVVIPPNLNPNAATYFFDFNLRTHRLYFQEYSNGKTLTPNSALKLFSGLSRDLGVMGRYGEAQITVVQDSEALTALFEIPRIKEITITILRPNPDIFADDFEGVIEEHLAATHSKSLKLTYTAEDGGSVLATDEIRDVGNVAVENGNVKVVGRDETGAITRSTDEFPKLLQTTYRPDETSERNAFFSLVRRARRSGQ